MSQEHTSLEGHLVTQPPCTHHHCILKQTSQALTKCLQTKTVPKPLLLPEQSLVPGMIGTPPPKGHLHSWAVPGTDPSFLELQPSTLSQT